LAGCKLATVTVVSLPASS